KDSGRMRRRRRRIGSDWILLGFSWGLLLLSPKDEAPPAIPTARRIFFVERCSRRADGWTDGSRATTFPKKSSREPSGSSAHVRPRERPRPMLYTLLCYNDESVTSAWTEVEDAA